MFSPFYHTLNIANSFLHCHQLISPPHSLISTLQVLMMQVAKDFKRSSKILRETDKNKSDKPVVDVFYVVIMVVIV